MNDADVLILGAGPAGCATALGLINAGVERVVLVDKPVQTPFRIGESATPDVPRLLRRLGFPADLAAQGHHPCHGNLSLWGGIRQIDDFLHRGAGHGWHLDRAAFDAMLRQSALQGGAHLVCPATIDTIARGPDGWEATIRAEGETMRLRTKVVVDAAGRRAPLATRLGANRYRIDTLVGLAAIAPAAPELGGLTLVEPCESGWWYAARLPDGRAIVTLMTDADIARDGRWRQPDRYLRGWQETQELRQRVPPPKEPFTVATFAAHGGFVDRAAGPGWLAVGDALIGFDPLTSSGIAGALDDALAAVATIRGWLGTTDCAAAGAAYGRRADATIKRYLAERQSHYAYERRWSEREFWLRRTTAATPSPTTRETAGPSS